MSAGAAHTAEPVLRGRTIITGRALQHLALGIIADTSGADPRDISVRWGDADGGLHASVTLPFTVGDSSGRTLEAQGADLRTSLVTGMAIRASRRVDEVDLRFSGVRRENTRRVR